MPSPPARADLSRRTACRACAAPLEPILSLGPIPLSDFPRSPETPPAHPPVPLDLVRCTNEACTLVQLAHTTPPDWLFRTYWYRSGINETMTAELRDIVDEACHRVALDDGDPVVDIGANDGTLLQQYRRPGGHRVTTIAWEPAINLYEALRPHAHVLYPEYFSQASAMDVGDRARIISAVACFYDLDDPHAFLDGITRLLHPRGLFVVQQAYLPAMLEATDFTNACHEHLAYHDLHSMEALLEPHGLEVVDVAERAINGGSFRLYIKFAGVERSTVAVGARRAAERNAWYRRAPDEAYAAFACRVEAVRTQLQALLGTYAAVGSPVDLYAASTKSQTLLAYCGLDHTLLRQAWERSPEKVDRYVGTTGIPIVSEAFGRADPPAALLVGAWAFREAFLAREAEYLEAGGRLIFPLPYVEIVEARR